MIDAELYANASCIKLFETATREFLEKLNNNVIE
jgi:hypothetical protein